MNQSRPFPSIYHDSIRRRVVEKRHYWKTVDLGGQWSVDLDVIALVDSDRIRYRRYKEGPRRSLSLRRKSQAIATVPHAPILSFKG